jgi:predicted deacylase
MTAAYGMDEDSASPELKFDVVLAPPDLSRWRAGNTGVPGFTTFHSGRPGLHVMIVALVHGNELAGAIALDMLLQRGVRPSQGQLTVGFANLDAFALFDPAHPTASRFVDEDLNRLWDPAWLDGTRQSSELARARAMRPLVETADLLLDLHSMLWPSDPLLLSGPSAKGRALAMSLGTPGLVVADHGHVSGPRLIDYAPFVSDGGKAAVLVEAGQHWESGTVAATLACIDSLLHSSGLMNGEMPRRGAGRCAEVTVAVTAMTAQFAFTRAFRGGEVIPERNTLIALDGTSEIRTPHDDCLLVMPSLRPTRGHTAVRLARFL